MGDCHSLSILKAVCLLFIQVCGFVRGAAGGGPLCGDILVKWFTKNTVESGSLRATCARAWTYRRWVSYQCGPGTGIGPGKNKV